MVYKIGYSPDGSLTGYMNFTLSYFDPSDFEYGAPNSNETHALELEHPETCRYHDYRYPPGHEKEYARTEVFWHILAARLAFVVVFQVQLFNEKRAVSLMPRDLIMFFVLRLEFRGSLGHDHKDDHPEHVDRAQRACPT